MQLLLNTTAVTGAWIDDPLPFEKSGGSGTLWILLVHHVVKVYILIFMGTIHHNILEKTWLCHRYRLDKLGSRCNSYFPI